MPRGWQTEKGGQCVSLQNEDKRIELEETTWVTHSKLTENLVGQTLQFSSERNGESLEDSKRKHLILHLAAGLRKDWRNKNEAGRQLGHYYNNLANDSKLDPLNTEMPLNLFIPALGKLHYLLT